MALLLINSFNAASDWFVEPRTWGVKHWVNAFQRPGLLTSLGNSLLIWSLTVSVSFPVGVAIAWLLARTKIPFSHTLEFLFWVSYMVPALPTTIAWITLLDPDIGMINVALKNLFHLDQGPFNIFSVPGIVWANLMGHGTLIKNQIPNYGEATVLASLTLLMIALIIPLQRWILERRRYTTITGSFRPGLIDLGKWNYVTFGAIALLLALLTVGPLAILILGSFMQRIGYFVLGYTLDHWRFVLSDPVFVKALRTTLILATTAAICSPLIFSVTAYILVRTRLPGRGALDLMIWTAGAIPGILAGLGLLWVFILTPGLNFLFGTIWALLIVVLLQGKTTGVNIMKGVLVQVGADMEEAARVSGAGWLRTYFLIWLPLLMPTLILLAVMNFVSAAGATSSIILLASRDTMTLSLMALELSSVAVSNREAASIISIFIVLFTMTGALLVRYFGRRFGVRHDMHAADTAPPPNARVPN